MEGYLCIGVVVALTVLLIVLAISAIKQERARQTARAEYQQSLARLKGDPTNADLRQRTLLRGRAYSNLTRKRKGVTVFDEVALMNDINAACAGAATLRNSAGGSNIGQSVEERLTKLAALKAKGLIDDQEYRARKQKILDEV